MKVISIVQLKGGAGKSTVAVNLAAMLSQKLKVGLLDADMVQGSAAGWFAIRDSATPSDWLKLATARTESDVEPAFEALADCDVVVVDCPPRMEVLTRRVLLVTDLAVMPLGALSMEVWAASDTVETLKQAMTVNTSLECRILWNKYRGTADEQFLMAEGKKAFGLKAFKSMLGYRAAFSDAAGRGFAVTEWRNQKASAEMSALVTEVMNTLKLKRR